MAIPIEVLEAEVMALAPAQRSRLLDRLLTSLDADADWASAWAEEVDLREADIAAGRSKWVPGTEAIERVRSGLG
jgi:Putative addiction module component